MISKIHKKSQEAINDNLTAIEGFAFVPKRHISKNNSLAVQ